MAQRGTVGRPREAAQLASAGRPAAGDLAQRLRVSHGQKSMMTNWRQSLNRRTAGEGFERLQLTKLIWTRLLTVGVVFCTPFEEGPTLYSDIGI